MGLLKHIRSRSKIKNTSDDRGGYDVHSDHHTGAPSRIPNPTAKYPRDLLQYLFTFVCPHTCDEALAPLEECMTDWYGCLLCVYRDLGRSSTPTPWKCWAKSEVAHCASVSRQWADAARNLL